MEISLRDSASVVLLTESLARPAKTNKLIIRIESEYFEAPERATGTSFNSIVDMFNDLGQALQSHKALTHLEIHGSSTNGVVYAGLNAVLNSRSLETLRISGVPCFLQGNNISMRCRRLKELSLQHVLLNTDQAVGNLWALIEVCSDLVRLRVTQTGFPTFLGQAKGVETICKTRTLGSVRQ